MKSLFETFKKHIWFALIFSAFSNILLLVPTIYILQVYDRVLLSRSIHTLVMLSVFAVIGLLWMMSMDVIRSRTLSYMSRKLDVLFSDNIVRDFVTNQASSLERKQNQLLKDLNTVRKFIVSPAAVAFLDLPWVPFYILVMCLFHPYMGGLAFLGALVLLIVTILNERKTKSTVKNSEVHQRNSEQILSQINKSAETIAALGLTDRSLKCWDHVRSIANEKQDAAVDANNYYKSGTKMLRQLLQVIVLGVGAVLVINQSASSGVMLAATIILGRALAPVEQAIGVWKQFLDFRVSWPRLVEFHKIMQSKMPKTKLPAPKGKIHAENVVYGLSGNQECSIGFTPIIKGISFSVEAGEMLSILGPSASGKSTLLRVLLGLYKPQSGSIRLDGVDISQWPRDSLGPFVGYLSQDIDLFSGTVSANIARRLGHSAYPETFENINHEKVIAAAKLARIHDMVLHLPDGYDTEIGSSGQLLSGGQKQRVALARAVYGSPRLVILDEPNANLDNEGDAALYQALSEMKSLGMTVVMVTHRAPLINLADKVLLIREGQLEKFGTRQEVEVWLRKNFTPIGGNSKRP